MNSSWRLFIVNRIYRVWSYVAFHVLNLFVHKHLNKKMFSIYITTFDLFTITMRTKKMFNDWMEENMSILTEMHSIVMRSIYTNMGIQYPIQTLQIDQDNLFYDLANYLYTTSNNANRHCISTRWHLSFFNDYYDNNESSFYRKCDFSWFREWEWPAYSANHHVGKFQQQ